jgi:hypothetical protein
LTFSSWSLLDQEIKYSLKEFLKDYKVRTAKNQEVFKKSLQRYIALLQDNFKEFFKIL